MPDALPDLPTLDALVSFIAKGRNDLQSAAIAQTPEIGSVLNALEQLPDCMFTRMSGSGATCFGIFEEQQQAIDAVDRLRMDQPGWWTSQGVLQTPFEDIIPTGQFKRATT